MKRFLKNFKFRKTDEMEQYIIFKSQRNAYFFLIASLFLWSIYESCQVFLYHARLNLLPGFLLAAAAVIQAFSQLFLTRNAVKDDEDSDETGPLFKIIILICVISGAAVTGVAAVVLMGVRT